MQNFCLLTLCIVLVHHSTAQITPPAQPTSGPGGSAYLHGGVTVYDYGTNGSGSDFWLYEPDNPKPDSANVVVFIHGLGMTNPKYYGAFIKHLVRKGNIVIYPRYQKDLTSSNTTFNDSCAKGILRALDTLQLPGHVKPRLHNYFVLGHSVGGVLTANMTMLHQQYSLPKPLTAFSMQPGAASFLMNSYADFPADVKYLIAVGDNDIIVGTGPGNTLFNQTTLVPTSHKNLIKHVADNTGTPAITASHDEPGAPDAAFDNGETNLFIQFTNGKVDAVDFYCYWKLQDALMDCALYNQNCDVAFGDTPQQHGMGYWSNGTPVKILQVTPSAVNSLQEIVKGMAANVYCQNQTIYVQLLQEHHADEILLFQLFDVSGRWLMTERVNSQSNSFVVPFAIGTYVYQLVSNTRVLHTGKVAIH